MDFNNTGVDFFVDITESKTHEVNQSVRLMLQLQRQ